MALNVCHFGLPYLKAPDHFWVEGINEIHLSESQRHHPTQVMRTQACLKADVI
jgi:hypothetical protein